MSENFEAVKRLEDTYQLNTYAKLPIAIERGEGVYVYDTNGKKYLDLYGGHAVALTGHCHPEVVSAVKTQAEQLLFYSNVVYLPVRARASQAIVDVSPKPMDKVFFCNSGAEANETALKVARRFTGKSEIIAMQGGFHGRTIGALSATALGNYREMFSPLIESFRFVPFGDIPAVEKALTDRTAGVILEPIQSMAGVSIADEEYYKRLRDICSDRGIVLIFDEVQTALGRSGSWFFGDTWGIVPDIITMAKGIAGGIPMGAVLIREHISKTIHHGEHGSTFGGCPVACAALKANIDVIRKEGLVENAAVVGAYIQEEVEKLHGVSRVKGRGLLLGIELEREAKEVCDLLLEKGVITGTSAEKNVLRLLPPLVLGKQNADVFIQVLRSL